MFAIFLLLSNSHWRFDSLLSTRNIRENSHLQHVKRQTTLWWGSNSPFIFRDRNNLIGFPVRLCSWFNTHKCNTLDHSEIIDRRFSVTKQNLNRAFELWILSSMTSLQQTVQEFKISMCLSFIVTYSIWCCSYFLNNSRDISTLKSHLKSKFDWIAISEKFHFCIWTSREAANKWMSTTSLMSSIVKWKSNTEGLSADA